MRFSLTFLLLASPLFAQKPHKPYVKPPEPMQRMAKSRQYSAVVEIPAQPYFSRLMHGEQWRMAHLDFPAGQRCERIPTFWADAEASDGPEAYKEIRLDNPSGSGVDVSAPQGRTIFISWTCR